MPGALDVPLKVWIHTEQGNGSSFFSTHIKRSRFVLKRKEDSFTKLLTQISAQEEVPAARIRHIVLTDTNRGGDGFDGVILVSHEQMFHVFSTILGRRKRPSLIRLHVHVSQTQPPQLSPSMFSFENVNKHGWAVGDGRGSGAAPAAVTQSVSGRKESVAEFYRGLLPPREGVYPPPMPAPSPPTQQAPPPSWPRLAKDLDSLEHYYPVLVVGSGYGGGIAACRLSAAGQTVCVLERGKEMWPGEYPDTAKAATEDMQIRSGLIPGVLPEVGPKNAFFDFRLEDGVLAWIGCGLGGGSLVNSGVCIAPDPRVFDLPEWPKEFKSDTRLKDGFTAAKAMLQPASYPDQGSNPLARATRAQEAAAALRKDGHLEASAGLANVNVSFEAHTNPAGVTQPACTLCGDCNTGCNVGAKNTVLMNYLPAAAKHGANIFCSVEVTYIEKTGGGEDDGTKVPKWTVHCMTTDPAVSPPKQFIIQCDTLILGAGTFGTTEILLRSREEGLAMSGQVGLKFGYNGTEAMTGIGVGFNSKTAGRNEAAGGSCGPCITSVIDCRDPGTDVRKGFIIEDMAVPSCFAEIVNVAFSAYSDFDGQPTDSSPEAKRAAAERKRISAELGGLGPWKKGGAYQNSIMWGVMGFDEQAGVMTLEEDQIRVRWPGPPDEPDPKVIGEYCKTATGMPTMEGTYLPNPFINTPIIKKLKRGTVHPFGGCCLADSAATGGCNHKGQLFSGETGTSVYESLIVCDGATVPSSLGVNPLWTISAIAERAMAILMEEKGWSAERQQSKQGPYVETAVFGSSFRTGHGFRPLDGGGGGGGGGAATAKKSTAEW